MLTKLFTVGYPVKDRLMFGVDSLAGSYDVKYARTWLARDQAIMAELGVEPATMDGVFGDNLRRFVGRG